MPKAKLSIEDVRVFDTKGVTPKYVADSNTLVLNQKCIHDGLIDWSFAQYISDEQKIPVDKYVKTGDLLINSTGTGTAGRSAYVDTLPKHKKVVIDSHMLLVRFGDDSLSQFFSFFLYSRESLIKTLLIGSSGQGELDKLSVFNIKFPYNNDMLDTFRKLLNAINHKIELNNKIHAELETIARDLYNYWFVQFEFPDESGRPYKTTSGMMVYNQELKRDIPAGWRVGSLLDIAKYDNGLACQKYRPTSDEYLRVIKIKEMHDGFSAGTEHVRSDIPAKAIINNGDVLFSWSASLEVMIWTGGKGALNQHIFKVGSSEYPKYFFYYQLVNYLQHFQLMAENRKTTMGHITQDHLKQSRIAIPPIGLIRDLDAQLSPMLSQKMAIEIENRKLAELRDFVLPMLMNGQVKVD